MKKKISILIVVLLSGLSFAGCTASDTSQKNTDEITSVSESNDNTSDSKTSYKQITQDEAKKMIGNEKDIIILDVRTEEEYAGGHIPDAVCIPNESITEKISSELPDKDQTILVYCRSGNRSKQASQKLADMGYKNVYEFGGINTWNGEIVK